MSEPSVKRVRTSLPFCRTHVASAGSPVSQSFPRAVEESLCGVSTVLMEISYRLESLRPATEHVNALLPALEILRNQWLEEMSIMVELNHLANKQQDPHTAGVIKTQFIEPLSPKVKLVGDLLTSARKVGCTDDSMQGFAEYLIDQLDQHLTDA
ncbi:hypothetical protein DNTS_026003 [Danionella cerebrum]|uniref:Uncharacterized protein n=1 Tax=Danionella cerebrum TaxID=2873325 RepID=A0A553PVH1_9TELE|nr:hypothetical protein DNTS_026003 [Danionella translucida]